MYGSIYVFAHRTLLMNCKCCSDMGLLPDTQNCGLRMRRECRERFPRHRLQRKPLVSDPGIHHGTCVTHVPWCMSGSLTGCGGENVPSIPSACATRNLGYLVRGPCHRVHVWGTTAVVYENTFIWAMKRCWQKFANWSKMKMNFRNALQFSLQWISTQNSEWVIQL